MTPPLMPGPAGIILILGGARSGKSTRAETLVQARPAPWLYLATAPPPADDPEMAQRIAQHRQRRGPGWLTVEEPLALAEAITRLAAAPQATVMVDCLTLWLANLMHAGRDIPAETAALVRTLESVPGTVVLVSNEVGQGIVPENPLARTFRDHAGRLHQAAAAAAHRVELVVAGLPMVLKGGPLNPPGPGW